MRFRGQPNMAVIDTKARPRKAYRFDKNGIIEIKDERLAKRFARRFKVLPDDEPGECVCAKCGREFKSKQGRIKHEQTCKGV